MRKNKLLVLLSMVIILSLAMMPCVQAISDGNTPQSEDSTSVKDKYLLFEIVTNLYGTGVSQGAMMDGETYNICSNPLQVQTLNPIKLTDNTVVLLARKIKLSGSAGGGENGEIHASECYSYWGSDSFGWNIEDDGTINYNNKGEWVKVPIGETFEDTQDLTPNASSGKQFEITTIRNYGFIDKSCLYDSHYSNQPAPTGLSIDITHPSYMEKGDWEALPYASEYYEKGRFTKTIGSFAKWSFNVPDDGYYNIGFNPGIIGAKYEVFQSGKLIDENYFKDYNNNGFIPTFSDTLKTYQLKKGARITVKVTLTEAGKELRVAKLFLEGKTNWVKVPNVPIYTHGVSGKLNAKDCKSDMFTYDSELDCIGSCDAGDYVSIPVDYGSGLTVPELLIVNAAISDTNEEKAIEVRLDAVDGKLLGTMILDTTGSKYNFQNQSKFFDKLNVDNRTYTGPHEIFLIFKGSKDIGNFKSLELTWTKPNLGSNNWSYTVKGPELPKTSVGDADGNGQIDSIDLAHMTKYLLGKASELPADNDMWAADINEDDSINSIDCGYLRKYLLGIIHQFPKY